MIPGKLEGHSPSCALNFGKLQCDCKLTLERVDRELDELEERHTAALHKHERQILRIEMLLRHAGIYSEGDDL